MGQNTEKVLHLTFPSTKGEAWGKARRETSDTTNLIMWQQYASRMRDSLQATTPVVPSVGDTHPGGVLSTSRRP
jgi:hypothetical protein